MSEEHQSAHFHSAPLSTGLLCAPCMDTVNGDVFNLILEYSLGPRPSPGSVRAVASVSRRFRDAVTRRPDWKSAARLPRFHVTVKMAVDPKFSKASYRCGDRDIVCSFFSLACLFGLPGCVFYESIAYRDHTEETSCLRQCCGMTTCAFMTLLSPLVFHMAVGYGLCGACCICSLCPCGSSWDKVN